MSGGISLYFLGDLWSLTRNPTPALAVGLCLMYVVLSGGLCPVCPCVSALVCDAAAGAARASGHFLGDKPLPLSVSQVHSA